MPARNSTPPDRRTFSNQLRNARGSGAPLLIGRLEAVGTLSRVSVPLIMFVSTLIHDVGEAVLWAYTLHYLACLSDRRIDMMEFADAFPEGLPTPEGREAAWIAQRNPPTVSPNNWLDDLANWPKQGDGAKIPDPVLPPRSEYLAAAKQRALARFDGGDAKGALNGFFQELHQHPDLKKHIGMELGIRLLAAGLLDDPRELRRFIDGFN